MQAQSVWELFIFLLNAMIFIILGAQGAVLIAEAEPGTIGRVAWAGALVGVACIVVRIVWVPVWAWLPRRLSAEVRRREPMPTWKPVALVSWTAMRGIVSLAAALALPRTLGDGTPFPFRTEIILMAMVVIILTLVVQGLTLAPIIRWMRFEPEHHHADEERLARREALRRGTEALEDPSHEPWADRKDVEWLRAELRERVKAHEHQRGDSPSRRRLRAGVIAAERRMLVRLRNEGAISDEVLRALEQELDLDAMRIGLGDSRVD